MKTLAKKASFRYTKDHSDTGASIFSQILNVFGAITQTFLTSLGKTMSFTLASLINPIIQISSLTQFTQPGIRNLFGTIAKILGIQGWTNLTPAVVTPTGIGIAIIALVIAMFALLYSMTTKPKRTPT